MTQAQSAFDFDTAALAAYLEQHVEGFQGPLTAEKFAGGQSNPTFLLTSPSGKYVLRRKPSGELLKSAHAVDREFRIMSALAGTDVPVAKAYVLCEDDSVIGSMFYVMEYLDGRVLWDPALPESTPAQRRDIYTEMNRVLAALHSVDIEAANLSDYGKPGNYFERQVSRWITQYRATELEPFADMETLIDWLQANMPADDGKVSIAHGDFRLDNMMFHKTESRVIALLDWELSTLGHPYADLSYQCMQLHMPHDSVMAGLGGLDREALGIPSEAEYVAMYCARMGLDSIPNWTFYMAFSAFRIAAILQGVKKRAVSGNASSEKAMAMGNLVPGIARMAVEWIS